MEKAVPVKRGRRASVPDFAVFSRSSEFPEEVGNLDVYIKSLLCKLLLTKHTVWGSRSGEGQPRCTPAQLVSGVQLCPVFENQESGGRSVPQESLRMEDSSHRGTFTRILPDLLVLTPAVHSRLDHLVVRKLYLWFPPLDSCCVCCEHGELSNCSVPKSARAEPSLWAL